MSMSHDEAMKALRAAQGTYLGRGADAEGTMFFAELELERGASGHNLRYRYRATRVDADEVLHDEDGILGVGIDGQLTLFAASSQYRHMFPRRLTRVELEPTGVADEAPTTRLVFAHNDPADRGAFRDEIAFELRPGGVTFGYRYAWGLPGGDLALRAAVTMTRAALLEDERPVNVRHWTALLGPDDYHYPGDDELISHGAPVGRKLGLKRIGVHVERVPTGRRTSYPHAEKTEEELVFVLAGHPVAWLDGHLHQLRPGDVVAFPPGTGEAHTFINNDPEEALLVVVGERLRSDNQIYYPLHPRRMSELAERAWADPPARELGPHDGLPDMQRALRPKKG